MTAQRYGPSAVTLAVASCQHRPMCEQKFWSLSLSLSLRPRIRGRLAGFRSNTFIILLNLDLVH
jgi:hypothetical protein